MKLTGKGPRGAGLASPDSGFESKVGGGCCRGGLGVSVAPVGLSSDLQLLGLFGFYYISLKKKFLISKNQ